MHHYYTAYRPRKRSRVRLVALMLAGFVGLAGVGTAGYMMWLKQDKDQTAHVASSEPANSSAKPQKKEASAVAAESPPAPPEPKRDITIPPLENGLAPVVSRIPTQKPVVFLTIDDGIHKDPLELELMKRHELTASLFLTYNIISNNPDFFKDFVAAGSLVENHTMTHRILTSLSYAAQKQEICDQSDKMEQLYGRRPVLFRPPGGSYNDDTRRAVAECGMKAVVMWSAKANGGKMEYQIGNGLRPGDIILMHFRPEFQQDLQSFVDAMHAADLRTDLLHEWLAI